jgi:class 3 adenylate cyclase/tetratricopeptide (TPR) repeat protein
MRCPACSYDNETTSRSCVACGVSFAPLCTHCGRDFPETARFCAWCGQPRKADIRVADVPGERKQATVLFADIAGSTARIAGLDAEEAMNFLHPIVMVMARAVHRFDGTVLRTLGDGLKAAFGVPHAREGHAALACHAALAMRAAVAALPDAPMIRIGLHSGEVVSGKLYSGSAVEEDVTGLTVHLASRIEQEASPGEICLSRDCQALLGAYCDTEPLGPRALKGIPDPIEIFRLIGLKPAVNSEHFRGASLTPLRGRAVELETLQRALLDTAPGSPRVIGVSGPPGVGKSRLCFEFGEWCRERQIKVLEARAQVHSRATPLLPVLEALRAFFRIEPDMDTELARTRIEQTLTLLAIPVAEHLATLTDFLGCAGTEPTSRAIDPSTRRARLRDSISRIVKAAWSQTSVIIIEDLHWLDEASLDFLETWMAAVEGTRVLMVLTFRPDWAPPSRPAWYRELALPELGLGEVGQVISDLIGDGPGLDQVVAHVAERSDGNPFFAEELILSLAQSGVLLGERGRYRLAPSGWQNPTLPTTVEAVIGARIDLLPDSEKALLQTAAIIGKEFPFEVVRAVTGLSDTAARPLLRRLRAAELIQPRETAMGESFAFRHPLIQEVAYAMQLRSTRTGLHAAVAKAIEAQDWGQRDEFAGLLAHHYEAAGKMVAAAMHLQRSARWVGRTNSGRALADWKKIRAMMQGQPRSKENDELRALAGGQLLTFGWREGMPVEEAKTYVEEALGYAREAGNRRHEAMLIAGYGRIVAASGGSADDYIRLVREALAVLDAEANPEEALLLNGLLCQANMLAGFVGHALSANIAALDMIDRERRGNAGVVLGLTVGQMVGFNIPYWIKCLQAGALVMLGRFSDADELLIRLFQGDPADAEPLHQAVPHEVAVKLAWFRNDTLAATRHANQVGHFATQAGNPYWFVFASYCQGLAASTAGDFTEADGFFRQALDASRRGRAGLEVEARILAFQADNLMRAGDPRRAGEVAADAIGLAKRKADRLAECHATLVAARACLMRCGSQDIEEASGLLARANVLIDETGAKAYEAMMLLIRAQISEEKGLAPSRRS